jgi:WD40 repeat protein
MPSSPEQWAPARAALVVATSEYDDPGLNRLRAPAQDAADVIDVLADPRIGGYPVTAVVNRPEHEIRRKIGKFLAARAVDDLVLLYLSCHGLRDARDRLYFAATDTEKASPSSTAVDSTWLLEQLEECRARAQILVLDCCYSGAIGPVKGSDDLDLERRLHRPGRGLTVLTASRAQEYSYEGVPVHPGGPTRSVFTAALVEGLRTGDADRDADGYVSVDEAYDYAVEQVARQGGTQTPQRWVHRGEGAVLLARNPSRNPRRDPGRAAHPAPPRPERRPVGPPPAGRNYAVAHRLTGHTGVFNQGRAVAFSPDGRLLATAGDDKAVRLRDTGTGEPHGRPLTGHRRVWLGGVTAVAFSPDGRLLASGGADKTVRLWDATTGEPRDSFLTSANVTAVTFHPADSSRFAVATGRSVGLWQLPFPGPVTQFVAERRQRFDVHGLAYRPDGRVLATATEDGATLWNADTGRPRGELLRGQGRVNAVAFSPDGQLLATAGEDRTVRLWDADTGRAVGAPLADHRSEVTSVAFRPDGRLLASGSKDESIRLWDPLTGRLVGQPLGSRGHTNTVNAVAFSPDGRLLASIDFDQVVLLWAADS